VAAAVVVAAALAGACSKKDVQPDPPPASNLIGREVAVTLPSLDGDDFDLTSLRGRPVVVHFSTTGSLASQADVEELRRVRAVRRDLQVVEVALDPSQPRLIRAWADASAIDWLVLLPTPGLVGGASEFGPIHVTPTTFLLDANGRIVWGREGGLPRGALARVLGELDAKGGHS
jgi:peroxiredoxin